MSYALALLTAICQYVVMVCIYCGEKTRVTNSRSQKKSNQTWRRRQCTQCQALFTTVEHIDLEQSLLVNKQSGHLEPFRRHKLFISIYDSLKHRKTVLEDAQALSETIIGRVVPLQSNGTITTPVISEETLKVLKRFDKVAFTHYQAFHS